MIFDNMSSDDYQDYLQVTKPKNMSLATAEVFNVFLKTAQNLEERFSIPESDAYDDLEPFDPFTLKPQYVFVDQFAVWAIMKSVGINCDIRYKKSHNLEMIAKGYGAEEGLSGSLVQVEFRDHTSMSPGYKDVRVGKVNRDTDIFIWTMSQEPKVQYREQLVEPRFISNGWKANVWGIPICVPDVYRFLSARLGFDKADYRIAADVLNLTDFLEQEFVEKEGKGVVSIAESIKHQLNEITVPRLAMIYMSIDSSLVGPTDAPFYESNVVAREFLESNRYLE